MIRAVSILDVKGDIDSAASNASSDAAAIHSIYAPYADHTPISLEDQAPSLAAMRARICQITAKYPWLVCEADGEIVGFAYASQYRERAAYRWSVDVGVYVRQGLARQGVGTQLYTELFRILTDLGYANAYAGITMPNQASVGLHSRLGFSPIGVYRQVGFNHGAWHDVSWWQKGFSHPVPPREPQIWRHPSA